MNLTPHHIIISKIIKRLTVEKNQFWRFLPVKSIITRHTNPIIKNTDKDQLKRNFTQFLGNFEDFSIFCTNDAVRNDIIERADQTLAHEFDYLGSGLTKLDPIDWHLDFKSGFRWSKGKFYKKYVTVDLSNNADVKVPWELSRCHHLLWLGEAFLLTKNEKYAKEVVDQIENWIAENPLMYSINWTCAMDVAIRAVNWMYVVNMVISSGHMNDAFAKKLTRSLFEHGLFIYNNLEKTFPYSANHYASDLTGLMYIGQFFKYNIHGKKWWQFALNEYYMEVRHQVLPSGVHFERSISYHRLMTEFFSYPYFMLLRLGETVPIDIHYRIKSMFKFIENYIKPNGLSPVIGDNDDGRLLPFIKHDFRDHRYLQGIAYGAFNESIFAKYASYGNVDSFFLLKQADEKTDITETDDALDSIKSHTYPDAGFAIIRNDDFYLFFNNSGLSKYPEANNIVHGTHTHADALSFELSIGGDDFIIDPGSYVYTASVNYRTEFWSSRKHNTVTVDNLNQNEFVKNNIFCVKGYHEPLRLHHIKDQNHEKIEGEFTWNFQGGETVTHKRSIQINRNRTLVIQDELFCQQPHTFIWYYHFAPDLVVKQEGNVIILITPSGQKINIKLSSPKEFNMEIIEDIISQSYGVVLPAKTLKISGLSKETFQIKTMIEPSI